MTKKRNANAVSDAKKRQAFDDLADALFEQHVGANRNESGADAKGGKAVAPHPAGWHDEESATTRRVSGLGEGRKAKVWRQTFDVLLDGLPQDYRLFAAEATELERCFRSSLAADLQPKLNEYLRSLPQDEYSEKQELASWVNGQLRQFGLAIKCPKTDRPAILVADVKDADSTAGRFRFEIRDGNGKRTRTSSSKALPELQLMEDEPRQEPFAQWTQRIGKTDGSPGKK